MIPQCILKRKCHKLLLRMIQEYLQPKIGGKIRIFSLARENNILIKKECNSRLNARSLNLCVSVSCLQKLQSVRKQYARLRRADTVPGVQKSFVIVQANFELWCALCQAQVKRTGLISDFNDFSCYLSITSLTYNNLVYITGECYMHY